LSIIIIVPRDKVRNPTEGNATTKAPIVDSRKMWLANIRNLRIKKITDLILDFQVEI